MKIDLKKELKSLYNASAKEPCILEVPVMKYIMIDGKGDPNTAQSYKDAVQAIYSASYTLKFMLKKKGIGPEYTVMPLEGLWWTDDMAEFSVDRKEDWKWTMMIMQPDFITEELFLQAVEEAKRKKDEPALSKLRFETYVEGISAQIMHLGPYPAEGPTIAKLHEYIKESGYKLGEKHHEIYFNDPRKTAPEKLKTIIRQPVSKG